MPIWYILATNGYVYAFTIGLKSFTRSNFAICYYVEVHYVHFPAVIRLNILYSINILNGKMGNPNAYLHENPTIFM